ncbi:MAG: site-2 protease family protein [Gemmatimonadales bacterium]
MTDLLFKLAEALVLFYAASWIALYLHELGHAAAAHALGVRVWGIRLGIGPSLFAGSIGGCRLQLGLLPLVGGVALDDADASAIGYRDIRSGSWRFEWVRGAWRAPVISAAGGACNLLGVLLAAAYWTLAGEPPIGSLGGDLAFFVAAANLSGYFNLVPCFSSDGVHLLAHVAAARRCQRGAPRPSLS